MKKLLGLFGAVALGGTGAIASSSIISMTATNTNQIVETNIDDFSLNIGDIIDDAMNTIIKNAAQLMSEYKTMPSTAKTSVAKELKQMSQLTGNDLKAFANNSQNNFVKKWKDDITNIFDSSNLLKMVEMFGFRLVSQDLGIDWLALNNLIDLDFGYSNGRYEPTVKTYEPASWREFWDFGMNVNFTEGVVNVMRVVDLVLSLYDGVNFQKLEDILVTGRNLFDFITHLDDHVDDTIGMFNNLLEETRNILVDSGIPIAQPILDAIDMIVRVLRFLPNQKIGPYRAILKSLVEPKIGMTFEELGQSYTNYFNVGIKSISLVNRVLEVMSHYLPKVVSGFFFNSIQTITKQMITADENHKGVYLRVEQFIIPAGFNAL